MSTSTELSPERSLSQGGISPSTGLRATAHRRLAARRQLAADRRGRREFAERLATAGPSERSDLLAAASRAGL
ncbi:MAG: hypothetical protein NVSMB13_05600 [Mycobacteriales bacterium]